MVSHLDDSPPHAGHTTSKNASFTSQTNTDALPSAFPRTLSSVVETLHDEFDTSEAGACEQFVHRPRESL